MQFSVTFVGDPRGKTATISYSIPGHGSGTIGAPIAGSAAARTSGKADPGSANSGQPTDEKTPAAPDTSENDAPAPSPSASN